MVFFFFLMGKVDTTLFIKNKGNDIIVVQIYVDNIIEFPKFMGKVDAL